MDKAPYGASIVDDTLFFKLLDGSTVTCACIKGDMARKVSGHACQAAAIGSPIGPLARPATMLGHSTQWSATQSARATCAAMRGSAHRRYCKV